MACANSNFYIKDKHYSNINYKIPCRYCVNCRIDRKKEWQARAEYEFKKHISGAFVTFTYSDEFLHLITGNDGKIRASTSLNDARKFIENLRKYCEKHTKTLNILRQKDFTYIGVTEYGENGQIFNRPHVHILFFGLDFKYNEKLFNDKWKMGLIDSLPILNGGIGYVLDYMDKQIMGKQAKWENFGRYGLEAPKQFNSKGFGSELYYNNFKNQKNGIIKSGLRQILIPNYYRQKMGIKTNKTEITQTKVENLKNYYKIKDIKNPNKTFTYKDYNQRNNDLEREYRKFYKAKEQNLLNKLQKKGSKIYIYRSF